VLAIDSLASAGTRLTSHAGASATTVIATAIIVAGFVIDSRHRMWLRPPELIEKTVLEGPHVCYRPANELVLIR